MFNSCPRRTKTRLTARLHAQIHRRGLRQALSGRCAKGKRKGREKAAKRKSEGKREMGRRWKGMGTEARRQRYETLLILTQGRLDNGYLCRIISSNDSFFLRFKHLTNFYGSSPTTFLVTNRMRSNGEKA